MILRVSDTAPAGRRDRGGSRSAWILGALVLAVGLLGAVGLHAFRERGAWLRPEKGKAFLCVQIEGWAVSQREFYGLLLQLWPELMVSASSSGNFPPRGDLNWEPPTSFRPGFLHVPLVGDDAKSAMQNLRAELPAPSGAVTGYRLALVNERGEVVHLDP